MSFGDIWVHDIRDPLESGASHLYHFLVPVITDAAKSVTPQALAIIQSAIPVYMATEGSAGAKIDAAWLFLEPKLKDAGVTLAESTAASLISAAATAVQSGLKPAVTP